MKIVVRDGQEGTKRRRRRGRGSGVYELVVPFEGQRDPENVKEDEMAVMM